MEKTGGAVCEFKCSRSSFGLFTLQLVALAVVAMRSIDLWLLLLRKPIIYCIRHAPTMVPACWTLTHPVYYLLS